MLLLLAAPLIACADEYEEYIEAFDLSPFDTLDSDTRDFLDELEVNSFDYSKISGLSFSDIINHILSVLKSGLNDSLKSASVILVFIMLSSLLKSFSSEINRDGMSDFYSSVSSLIICVFLASSLTETITLSCETVLLCSEFAFAFFPAFCVIVAASGGSATSFSVNTMLMTLAQGLNVISAAVFIPVVNCFLALGICSSVRKEMNLTSLITSLKQMLTSLITAAAGLFISVLSMKTAVSAKADALGIRSLRFAINTAVPVIGPSVSEGLISIQSYSSMIKTSVGIVGIISVFSVFLPALSSVLGWRFTLFICKICSDVFEDVSVSSALNAFREALLIIEVILLLSMLTTVISIGILVAAKTVN